MEDNNHFCNYLCHRKVVSGFLGVMLWGIIPIASALAQGGPQSEIGTRWALLVGIGNYPDVDDFEITRLKAPAKDVDVLYAFLTDPQKGNFPSEQVIVLKDAEATRDEILLALNDIARKATADDLVLFYFSGHGYRMAEATSSTYLLPYFTSRRAMSDPKTTCIDFDDLAYKIRTMEANKVIVILDVCHAGGVKPLGSKDTPSSIYQRFVEAFQEAKGRSLLLSSDESEVSWETPQGSVFTQFLMKGLEGAADANEDGIIGFMEVAAYVEKEVRNYTRLNFPKTQTPTRRYEQGPVYGDIPLAVNLQRNEKFRRDQQDLLDKRNGAIFQASLEGLDQSFKEFSLKVAQSAYRKAFSGEPLTEKESLLLAEIDALEDKTLAVADYIVRARAIYNLPEVSGASPAQLRIEVIPVDATVTLTPVNDPNRVIPPFSPNFYRIAQGRYRLSVQRTGYTPESRELVLSQESEKVTVTLERLMGTLDLQVTPADASVTISPLNVPAPDAEISESKDLRLQPAVERDLRLQPTFKKTLPVGTYRVTAEKEGYKSIIKEPVEITANASTRLVLTLEVKPPGKGKLLVKTTPIGARIYVDGKFIGYAPKEIPNLLAGQRRIRLVLPGKPDHEQVVNIRDGVTEKLSYSW